MTESNSPVLNHRCPFTFLDMTGLFGDEFYAKEESRIEIGSHISIKNTKDLVQDKFENDSER